MKIPKFKAILFHKRIQGTPYALAMNSQLIEILAKIPPTNTSANLVYISVHNIIDPDELGMHFAYFIKRNLNIDSDVPHKNIKVLAA